MAACSEFRGRYLFLGGVSDRNIPKPWQVTKGISFCEKMLFMLIFNISKEFSNFKIIMYKGQYEKTDNRILCDFDWASTIC